MKRWIFALLLVAPAAAAPLRVGVSLPAYASWTAALTKGLDVEIVPLAAEGFRMHGFEPTAAQVGRLGSLDLVIEGGLGHDTWARSVLRALPPPSPHIVDLHAGVPLITAHGSTAPNSHTFVGFTVVVAQVRNLEREISKSMRTAPARLALTRNSRSFLRRVRRLRSRTRKALAVRPAGAVATVHDGYAYLLNDLDVPVELVVQPRHGVAPSAHEITTATREIKARGVRVLLTEGGDEVFANALAEATGVRLARVHHGSLKFAAGAWIEAMRQTCASLEKALLAP